MTKKKIVLLPLQIFEHIWTKNKESIINEPFTRLKNNFHVFFSATTSAFNCGITNKAGLNHL